MADLPTRQELFRRWRNAALAVPGTRVSPREIDRAGSDLNLLAAASSIMGEEIVNRAARAYAACFEATARRECLDRVVFDRKGLPRLPAAPSVGMVRLERAAFAGGAGTIVGGLPGSLPTPTRIRTQTGITYLLTRNSVWGALDLGPFYVPIQAELAGLESEVDEGQAWSWADPPFDTTIEITNDDPTNGAGETAGAADEETDEAYQARARNFFNTVRRGTTGAVEFGLRSTPGIASVAVYETLDASSSPACSGRAYVLDALGQASQTLAARGALTLIEYRPIGIPVVISEATPQYVSIKFVAAAYDTRLVTDTGAANDDVRTAIIGALENQQAGGLLYRSTILAAARSVVGFVIEDTNLTEPAATLIPATSDLAFRTRRELILIS